MPSEARFLTAFIALTTEAGFTVTKQDFVGFSDVTPVETLFFHERNLHDVIIKAGPKQDRLLLRHRTIADLIINNCLDEQTLKKVYLRILSSLAPEINIYDFKYRKFAMYREIINHYKVYKSNRRRSPTCCLSLLIFRPSYTTFYKSLLPSIITCKFIVKKTMSTKYKFVDKEGIYFTTSTVVDWVDVFTRDIYRDILLDSIRFCQLN